MIVLLDLVIAVYQIMRYTDIIISVVTWMFQVFTVCKIGGISHLN